MQSPEPDFRLLAAEFGPRLTEREEKCSVDRRVPDETVRELTEAGFFRMLQPSNYGGYERHPAEFLDSVYELAAHCPSTAWIYGVIAVHAWQLALFPKEAQGDVWADDQDTLISSSYMPVGELTRVGGGYRLSGRWGFSSGCDHCTWVFLGAFDNEAPQKEMLTLLLPRSDYEIVDDWFVSGLRGTGSKSIVVEDAFVPSHRTHKMSDGFKIKSPGNLVNPGPLYRLPFGQLFTRTVASPAVGMLQGALDAFLDGASKRTGRADGAPAADDPANQVACSRAAAAIRDVKASAVHDYTEMWEKAVAREPMSLESRILYRASAGAVTDRMVRCLDDLFLAAGGGAIWLDHPLHRFFQDVHAARAHHANNPLKSARNHGGTLLGKTPVDYFL